jgi:hypothetical protein
MASIEIYVRECSSEQAGDWLRDYFGMANQVRTEPAITFEAMHEGETVRVFVAEGIEGGPYTSIWFNGRSLPWEKARFCARDAHAFLGNEVICDRDGPEIDPWAMLRFRDGEREQVDQRDLPDF